VLNVSKNKAKVEIGENAYQKIDTARKIVEDIVEKGDPIYGINTGFGKFCNVQISKEELTMLQENLIMSHACGVGDALPEDIVRGIMILRMNNLSKGHSGISRETFEQIKNLLNHEITPFIPEQGSLGASGDLAPLSHMALALMGLGDVFYKGLKIPADEALKQEGLKPIQLKEKEGLALINGTQVMTSIGVHAIDDARKLIKFSDLSAAMTTEAINGITDAFYEGIHEIRNQTGQIKTAENMRNILKDSKNTTKQAEIRVQDAYTIRCIPQIHGASKDAINYVSDILDKEINAVTDNPLIFPENGKVISGGNFHGQPVALAMDFLGIAISEIANVSERRIERLVNPQLSGMPAFLSNNGGLNSGYMIPQYVAASLVSENKVLAHPASVDSIPSSANQEDHVSMGTTAARKAKQIVENVKKVIAIEFLAAAQAIDIKDQKDNLSSTNRFIYDKIREKVSFMEKDRIIHNDIVEMEKLLNDDKFFEEIENKIDLKI
jgi:histidine ammonia-lyase